MLAEIQQSHGHYAARFERRLRHSVDEVWAYLTENDKLERWFSELRVDDLREGGVIKFDMRDGTFEDMLIITLAPRSVMEFTWADDRVRFELEPESGGCRLTMIETLNRITAHTPKDLAGWHVCLDVIAALLDGKTVDSRKQQWEAWHGKYVELMERLSAAK
ncbi:MAG: activator of Hsp90 ATPase 1 family protein [Paenibacillus sp.]|jgi:uncharacterized protein YndB with AHSA1/START domain|nr:activator of Hsp90 ATPase 1 family protein [Paenibacillus sp.]